MASAPTSTPVFTSTDLELNELLEMSREISDLESIYNLVEWDQQVMMPPRANRLRGQQIAAVLTLLHERKAAPRLGVLLDILEPRVQGGNYSDADRGLVRVLRRNYDQHSKLSVALVKQVAEASAQAWGAWEQAKPANNFAALAPHLTRLVSLKREVAEQLGYRGSRYDALLDQFEPGMTLETLTPILSHVRDATVNLLQRIQASGREMQTRCIQGDFEPTRQIALCTAVLQQIGYRFEAGRLDPLSHAFSTTIGSPDDVRVTTRVNPSSFAVALMAAIHEGGHAVFEQGIAPALTRTVLAGGASMGLHESQSRLWENYIGRSLPFWKRHLGLLHEAFPEISTQCDVEALTQALNAVKPSLIRTEADEVTYNLHIIIRFELEKGLIEGEIDVNDLPQIWNQKYQAYLGMTPPTDTQGVLQDIHWSEGSFGYFPTYTLGNLYAAQIYQVMRRTFPDYDQRLETEGTGFILERLREHMYVYGQMYSPGELLRKVTGEDLNPEYFVEYAQTKFGTLYGLAPV